MLVVSSRSSFRLRTRLSEAPSVVDSVHFCLTFAGRSWDICSCLFVVAIVDRSSSFVCSVISIFYLFCYCMIRINCVQRHTRFCFLPCLFILNLEPVFVAFSCL